MSALQSARIGLLQAALLMTPAYAFAAGDIFVYPAKGQSDQQLSQDRYECHRWAVSETDFDPMSLSNVEPPRVVRVPVPRNETEGATAKGAITGAVAGGIIGAGDRHHGAGQGVAIGAIVGTIVGAAIEGRGQDEAQAQANSNAQQQVDEQKQSQAERTLARANYRRAITACLVGRGYTVR